MRRRSLGNVLPEEFAARNLLLQTDPIRPAGTIKNDLQILKLTYKMDKKRGQVREKGTIILQTEQLISACQLCIQLL